MCNVGFCAFAGSYYTGEEDTYLGAVSVVKGSTWYPCCTMDDTVDICAKPPAPYFNPGSLRFYCEGHLQVWRATMLLSRCVAHLLRVWTETDSSNVCVSAVWSPERR